MNIVNFFDRQKDTSIICLGRFDGIHIGHKSLLDKAKQIRAKFFKQADVGMFCFKQSDPISPLKWIFTFEETVNAVKDMDIDKLIVAPLSKDFYAITKDRFLSWLKENFSPVAIICGEDYTFGMNREGDVEYLKEFCSDSGIMLSVVPTVMIGDNKVSSSNIKKLLSEGLIKEANEHLGHKYFICGQVEKGRGDGSKIGFATANIKIDPVKAPLKDGVYKTLTEVDGTVYKSLSNYGFAPTFNDEERKIETHIIGDPGVLYGKTITVYFTDYLRETISFSSKAQLVEQLKEDFKNI